MTATESLKANVRQEFPLSAPEFSIDQMRSGGVFNGRRTMPSPPIDYREAMRFKRESRVTLTSPSRCLARVATVTRGSLRTDPNVTVQGVDELYLPVSGLGIAKGRNFTPAEIEKGHAVVLLGQSVVDRVFESWEDPWDNMCWWVRNGTIAGVLEARGTTFGMSQDNQILMPLLGVRRSTPTKEEATT